MKFFLVIATSLFLLSCSSDRFEKHDDDFSSDFPSVTGKVIDMEGNAVEHIRVTLRWSNSNSQPEVVYTSSEGVFYSESDNVEWQDPLTIEILMEDIDGEDFGGLYESRNDVIKVYKDELKTEENIRIELTYYLRHATVSASSLQF